MDTLLDEICMLSEDEDASAEEPADKALYARVKREAKKKFDVYPSIYANYWVQREYKRRGGSYRGRKNPKRGLLKWRDEKWVDLGRPLPDGGWAPCGRPSARKGKYPKCVPLKKAKKMTPEQRRLALARKRRAEAKVSRKKGRKPRMIRTF